MSEAVALPKSSPLPLSFRLLGDRGVVRLAARGDQRAFTAIYERYHQPLYRYCRSILGSESDALDALQNTMASVLRALPGERREIALKPWLFRIAHNESIALLRARRPHQNLSDAEEAVLPGVEEQALGRDKLRQLMSDLRELPERQCGALVMRELSGLSYKEIAASLGTSPAVAKQTVYEARSALQEQAEGREMSCDAIRRTISARDRRILRGRRVRAHLRSCSGCRDFRAAIETRPAELGAIAPPVSAAAAAAALRGLLGGGAQGGGGGGALAAAAGGSKAVAGSVAFKLAVVGAITVSVGAGMRAAGVMPALGDSASSGLATSLSTKSARETHLGKSFVAQQGQAEPKSTRSKQPVSDNGNQPAPASSEPRTHSAAQTPSLSAVAASHLPTPPAHPSAPSSHPIPPSSASSHQAPTTLPASAGPAVTIPVAGGPSVPPVPVSPNRP